MLKSVVTYTVRNPLLFWLSLALVAACTTAGLKDKITFSHHLHTEQELGCTDCHYNVTEDAETETERITMDGCSDCHDVEDEESCASCHSVPDDPGTYPPKKASNLLFAHSVHEDMVDDCAMCHGDAAHATGIPSKINMMPGHKECADCHQDELDMGKCTMCHDRLDLYPRKPKYVFSHEGGFFEKHGAKAAGNEETCATCHDQSFCADCHNKNQTMRPSVRFPQRVDRSFMHAGDWISRHSLEASNGQPGCLKCHGTSYCNACHERNGRGGALGLSNPHPAAAVWMAPSGPDSHGTAARRNIVSCASCHDQGASSNCVECHRSGRVNPHPPGFKSPVSLDERDSHPMCSICH